MAPGRRSVIGIYTQLVEHGGVRKLLPKCWVGARAVDHLREQAPGLARDSGVGPPACHERLLPDDGAQGRRGHDEKEILAVHVNDMGKIRGAEHRPERLDGLCLAEDARAIALPIVLDAQLRKRLFQHPAPVAGFDPQDDVRNPSAKLGDRDRLARREQAAPNQVRGNIFGCGKEFFGAHGADRKSSRSLLNSAAFSSCGTCPHSSKTTSFAPAMAFAYRSPAESGISASSLPQTTSVSALIESTFRSSYCRPEKALAKTRWTVKPSLFFKCFSKTVRTTSSLINCLL